MSAYPVVSHDQAVQAFYEACRARGESHLFAELAALRQPPMIAGTDSAFLAGKWDQEKRIGKRLHERYRRQAEAAGVDTTGKLYMPSLCREGMPGDPRAWVSGRGDIIRICEQQGAQCTGRVNVKMRDDEPAPTVDIAPDIVNQLVAVEVAKDPEKKRKLADTVEEVKAKHTPKWKKKGA